MNKKYHFITGLPRSGSSLLSSILSQNPRFHAAITDPLAAMINSIIEDSDTLGSSASVSIGRRKNIIKGLFNGFYEDVDKEIIFNTNRSWTYLTHQIDFIYPESKFLLCVRDINWVLDSIECAHRRNPLKINTITKDLGISVYQRVEKLMSDTGIVGFAYAGIKQAITGNEKNKLMLIEYDHLCKFPENVLKSVYSFIDEPYYQHNFSDVEKSWEEYDKEIGIEFHKVRKKIEHKPREFIIPPDILQQYNNCEFWRAP